MKEYTVKVMMPGGPSCYEALTDKGETYHDCPFLNEGLNSDLCTLLNKRMFAEVKLPNCPAKED